jgi:hypothetical protein
LVNSRWAGSIILTQIREGALLPVAHQKACDWCNVKPVTGLYVKPVIGDTKSCAVTGANHNAAFACHTHTTLLFPLCNHAV